MDWGLFSKDAGDNKFLREQIVYEHKVKRFLFEGIFKIFSHLPISNIRSKYLKGFSSCLDSREQPVFFKNVRSCT